MPFLGHSRPFVGLLEVFKSSLFYLTMKLVFAASFLLSAVVAEDTCTHGKLFVTDMETTNIHVFDVSKGNLDSLSPETTIDVGGKPGINLQYTASGKEVAAIFRGTENLGYADAVVNFVDTGVGTEFHGDHYDIEYSAPTLVQNARIDCARPIHFVRHDDKIAIFCDGSYTFSPQINSTIWVVEEGKFGSTTESAIVYNETLQGSHHGVAIPVDDNHVLYSLASADRINRTTAGEDDALPDTFQVVDYQGTVLHSIADESDPNTHCSGFHGSSAVDDTFALACDIEHGGILIVDYEAPGMTYTSRSLSYPDSFPEHRSTTLEDHPMAKYIVGNFFGQDQYHLMAFSDTDTTMTTDQILTLDSTQCAYAYERGQAEVILVLMPNGMLHAFEFDGTWEEIAKLQVVPDMQECSEVQLVPGVMQAFVLHKGTNTLYAVDMDHVHDGEMEVSTSQLTFTPFDAVVSGVPPNVACQGHDHGHQHTSAAAAHQASFFLVRVMILIVAVLK